MSLKQLDIEEELERRKLVGYCDRCEEWYKFTDDPDNIESRNCPACKGLPSTKIGYQLTTQRTFNPKAKKLSKAQIKKMGMGA